jgi:hypothetical protein
MIQCHPRVGIIVAAFALVCGASAQNTHVIKIDPGGEHAQVCLSYPDAAAENDFARLFEIPRYLDYKPFALLLTNNSGKAVVALTIRWTATAAGKSSVFDSSSSSLLSGVPGGMISTMMQRPVPGQSQVRVGQSYISASPVVLAGGERMLVAPGLFARESMVKQRGTAGGSSGIPRELQSAESISASIDAVVMEDGEVLGPDATHTVDDLVSRKAAIDDVVKAVRAAELGGQDGAELLRQLANATSARGPSPEARQQASIARMLIGSRQWREQLENE